MLTAIAIFTGAFAWDMMVEAVRTFLVNVRYPTPLGSTIVALHQANQSHGGAPFIRQSEKHPHKILATEFGSLMFESSENSFNCSLI